MFLAENAFFERLAAKKGPPRVAATQPRNLERPRVLMRLPGACAGQLADRMRSGPDAQPEQLRVIGCPRFKNIL